VGVIARDPGSALSRRRFLAALGVGGALSCAAPETLPVTRPDPQRFDACRKQRSLTVLTWNIFLMPKWIRESPSNDARARAIAAVLLEPQFDFDILCLQKVFDSAAREILEQALADRYPHRFGPANDSCSLKLNSGVWLLSRYPLTDYQEIQFSECSSWECFSRKGALLVSGTCGTTPFRLIATHLQGEEGSSFTEKNQAIRDSQMREIRDRLITPHLEPQVPLIICGDFGTPRLTADGESETKSYREMVSTLGVENGAELRITLDDSKVNNQLAINDTGRRNELDYVFLRTNGFDLTAERTRHVFRRGGWDTKQQRTDLSYRYGVSARLRFGPERQG
jgi:endonuclease/exonuclease/phosphatase family metal-dependent hydrolase